MNPEIKAYREFIDLLVKHSTWSQIDAFKEADLADTPYEKPVKEVLSALTPEQRNVLASYIQGRYVGGMQNTLRLLDGFKIINPDGIDIPDMTIYGEGWHYDFLWRVEGGNWDKNEED